MIRARFLILFLHLLSLYELCTSGVSPAETGNALVGCAACQGLTVKDFKCNVNCEVLQNNGRLLFHTVIIGILFCQTRCLLMTVNFRKCLDAELSLTHKSYIKDCSLILFMVF